MGLPGQERRPQDRRQVRRYSHLERRLVLGRGGLLGRDPSLPGPGRGGVHRSGQDLRHRRRRASPQQGACGLLREGAGVA